MQIEYTYLKNNGLYQSKLSRLIYENNVTIRVALEVYNLFHGSRNKLAIKYDPLFQEYYQTLGELVPETKKLLGSYSEAELEYMMDIVVDYCWRNRFQSSLDYPLQIFTTTEKK